MSFGARLILYIVPLSVAAAQSGALEGYVFREADGGSPRRPLTVELLQQGRARYHAKTRPDGGFTFKKVRAGRYTIRARYNAFVIGEEIVTVSPAGRNFAAIMLPKRRAGAQTFGSVSADRLAEQSDRALQKKLRQASRLVEGRDVSRAIRLYEEIVSTSAQPEVWDTLGALYLYAGKNEAALQAFEKAIGQDPKYLLPYAHLAAAYLERRQYKELAAVAQRALRFDPEWLTGHTRLGEALAAEGNLDAALRSAETASRIAHGRAPDPYLLLAKIQWARRDCTSARDNLQRYLELNTSARGLPGTLKSLELVRACRPER